MITVRPRNSHHNDSWGTLIGQEGAAINRRELKAFCENHRNGKWRVPGIYGFATEVKVKREESMCPICGYSIFWSREYKERENEPR